MVHHWLKKYIYNKIKNIGRNVEQKSFRGLTCCSLSTELCDLIMTICVCCSAQGRYLLPLGNIASSCFFSVRQILQSKFIKHAFQSF